MMVKGLHSKYTTSASMLQIKMLYNIDNEELAKRLKLDINLIKKWIKGIEQICFENYRKIIEVFPEMKGRISYGY